MRSLLPRAAVFLLIPIFALSCATTTLPLNGNSSVVRDVRVFDGQRVVERTHVFVRDGRIATVGQRRPPAGLPVVDGTGRTLLPGFIDAHVHVQSEAGLRNALRFGVTALLDMFTRIEFLQGHRTQRNLRTKTDFADLYSAGAPVTSAGGMGTPFGITFPTISGPEEASAFARARLAEGSDYIKVGGASWSSSITWFVWLPALVFELALAVCFLTKGVARPSRAATA